MKYRSIFALSFFALITLIAYQNCGQDLGNLSETGNASSLDTKAIPIEASLDKLAVMSCQGNGAHRSDFFTFKMVGTESMTAHMRIARQYKDLSQDDRLAILRESEKLRDSQLALSLRDAEETRQPFTSGTTQTFGAILHSEPVTIGLGLTNFFSLTNQSVWLDFRDTGAVEDIIENLGVNGDRVLHLGFRKNTSVEKPDEVMGPFMHGDTGNMHAYGNAYRFSMQPEILGGKAYYKTISSINERILLEDSYSLSTKNVDWSCNKYMIIPQDHSGTEDACLKTAASQYQNIKLNVSNASERARVNELYKVLGPGWKYATSAGQYCIRHATKKGCYPQQSNVIFRSQFDCDPTNSNKLCLNYLSVCSKTKFDDNY